MEEQQMKCPRCKSLDTRFCYFNNHSRSQPRYYCKECKRRWTLGGALRDIPIGGVVGSRPRRPRHARSTSLPSASEVTPRPPQSLPQEVVQNEVVSSLNPISQPFNQFQNGGAFNIVDFSDLSLLNKSVCSLPIAYTYHQGSGGGLGACYLSATVAEVQSLNASSQAPFNQSLNGGGVNVGATTISSSTSTLVEPLQSLVQNQLVSPSIPITNTYHYGSVGGGAHAGYLSSFAGVQSLNHDNVNVVGSNPTTNTSSSPILTLPQSLVQNQMISPSLPITSTYDHNSVGGEAQGEYLSSLAGFQSLNDGATVVSSSDLALLSGSNAADSHYPEIESLHAKGLIQHSMADNNDVGAADVASHYTDHWSQSFINTDNNVATSNVVSWDDMFNITSNISGGNSDLNFSMPNHGHGLPGYDAPPSY